RAKLDAMDVTDSTFESDVIERSAEVPVVVDLWADWCGPCKTLGPILEKVIAETDGKIELAQVAIVHNPQVAGASGVQQIPAVVHSRRVAAAARLAGEGVAVGDDVTARLDSLLDRVKGDDDARQEFVDLLETMGPEDPRTVEYRKQLTARLF